MKTLSQFLAKNSFGLVIAALLGSWLNCSAQTYWTACYLNASSYSCTEGGSISGTVYREHIYDAFGSGGDYDITKSYAVSLYISPSGTYQIQPADVTSGGVYTVTIPANSSSANFSISFNDNTNLEYDRTGTLNIGSGRVDSSKTQSANLTLYDNDSLVAVLFTYTNILEGGVSGANQTVLRFVRNESVTQARTINYNFGYSFNPGNAVAGVDYTPTLGTITIPQGSSEADVTLTANNANQTENKALIVHLLNGQYQIWPGYTDATLLIMADHPDISVYPTSSTMTRNESTGAFTFYESSYYPGYSQARTIHYTVGGTAANGVDFTPSLSGSIVIPAGVGSVTTSTLTPGTNLTGTKVLTLTITNGIYGIDASASNATIGILDDAPVINVTAPSQYAYQGGQSGQFNFTRSGELNKAVTVNYSVAGTATSVVNYTALPASVTFAANQTSTNLTVTPTSSPALANAATVVLTLNTNANYFFGKDSQAVVTLLPNSDTTNSVSSPVDRYWRGSGSDPTYWSIVVPVDGEKGTPYDNLYGNAFSLYGISSWGSTLYHYNAASSASQTNNANRIAFNNPIVAFGERVGGTPLYLNQPYSFGVYAGDPGPLSAPFQILVYYRTNFALAGYINLYPPNSSSTSSWNNYTTNGFQISTSTNYLADGVTVTTNNFGLQTTLSSSPDLTWGASQPGAYELTHTANDQATNYYYVVEAFGYLDNQGMAMVQTSGNQTYASELYTLEFESRPTWRSVFLDQPHFDGSPLPPFYAGKTLAEMLTNTPPVTNAVTIAPSSATNLDDSPELRRSPILDQFVKDMGNDPIALANYVINDIDLTDPMDYSDNGDVSEQAINPGGVSRGALGTFMEKEGSPLDQCALLVYLLREAGVPAVYEFPPRGGLKILDARLSRMLKFQVHGAYSEAGQQYTTNTMITVNYPWVAAYIGTNWVHIFPWMKDYQMTEGLNLWDEMPSNYSSAYPWIKDYIYGRTNLLSLAQDDDNTLRVIFPRFLQQTVDENHPGISVGDIGMDIYNRQHYYSRWQDFPTPTWVTNVSTSVESLTSSGIAGISPTLTNIFDTVSVEIYSKTDPNKDIQTGDMRLCDVHNREVYIYQTATNNNQVQLSLILMPFRTNIVTQYSFTNDSTLLSKEVLSMNLDQYDDQLEVRFKYNRHRALSAAYAIDPNKTFFGLNAGNQLVLERPLRKGDQAAICLSYGRVTPEMLNVHAQDIWRMENALRLNPSLTNSISPDVYEGASMYLAGMTYYEKVGEFDQANQNLNKICDLSSFAAGLSKIGPARDSSGNLTNNTVYPVLPNVDMFFWQVASVANGTAKPDSGQNDELADQNYNLLAIADGSSEEHQAVNTYYGQTNAVSTVRLLQLAQSSGAGIVSLNINNYAAQGTTSYQGKPLEDWDSNLWSQVVSAFQAADGSYVTAYITPGPMTNSAYKGMGALILGWHKWQALISPQSLNGAFGQPFSSLYSVTPFNTPNYDLNNNNDNGFTLTMNQPASGSQFAPTISTIFDYQNTYNEILSDEYVINGFGSDWNSILNYNYGLNSIGSANDNYASVFQLTSQYGDLGTPNNGGSSWLDKIGDPVRPLTGEFYIDDTDLKLPGPMPLTLRRNYSSQNVADNQFGTGWKMNIMPYLQVNSGGTNIYAADLDGAVLAYVQTTTNVNVWLPTLAANPQLDNNTTAGVGGLANRLRDRLIQTVNGSITNYTLYAADGSVRTFQVMTFDNGILNQTRPYLQKWTDNRGNYYTFTYGTDSNQPNFGQVTRIQSSNGNYLGFYYDVYGHITQAYTGDGRRFTYTYDQYGDLVKVMLPDATTRSYKYQHLSQSVTNGSAFYSTHLITEEDKPDGRELINEYDDQRRVTNQLSTAGVDLIPIRTASFIYDNNFVFTNAYTNAVSGYTLIIDGNNHTNRYDYTNSLITKVTDPLGQTIQQSWYSDNATAPGYPRSVQQRIDKRGLVTQYKYDANGNVTNTVIIGDITGDGITTQTATNTAVYNGNSLPVKMTDPAGNSVVTVYDPTFPFLPQQIIHYAGTTPVSTNFMIYGDATNVVVNGNTTQTNMAFGLLTRKIRAYGSPDAATNDTLFDGHGFPTETISYTGTSDPNVTNFYFYNERGDRIIAEDVLGAYAYADYDAMNRPVETENFDASGNPLAWNFSYYNDNGEVSWVDGPRYNPEDYVFYDYDGAGRVDTEIHWRSEAKSDGTGVEAPSGYNLYAQTFYEYDPLGNLILKVDPRGAETTNTYDAICRLVQAKHIDTDGTTVLSTEGYGYEPGGQVHYYTNALGGVTTKTYTITGQPEYQRNPDGSTNAWRYYLDGRIKRKIQSNGAYWQTTYDDADRLTTKVFYSASGVPEATNSTQLDRRGNAVQTVDAGDDVFTTTFDGLDRPKVSAGPAIVTVSAGSTFNDPNTIVYTTNVMQQVSTNFYDAAGRSVTNINALGEKSIATSDSIGRPVSKWIYGASGALERETYFSYSPDHNSVTTTNGSGTSSIVKTVYTDNSGHTVLSVKYPLSGYLDYTWNEYDLAGNLSYVEHDSSASGSLYGWTFTSYTHDGLNRVTSMENRDDAYTYYHYDALNDLTNRTLPGGLQWQATYNNAGQILQEKISGGGESTRTNTYTYYASGSPFAGLLDTKTNGRGLVSTYSYDDWLRKASVDRTDPNYSYVDTSWGRDARGYTTNMTESVGSTTTVILRTFDPYGQLASENITVNGAAVSGASQSWDAAGRRTGLGINGASYNFASRADGALTYVSDPTGSGNYDFDTAGILTSRTVGNRQTTITSRDGEGRPSTIVTTVNGATVLTEDLTRYLDGTLSDDTLYRSDFTDSRSYSYSYLSRRLTQETLNLNGSTTWTNHFGYDDGAASGLGVLTSMGATGSALWNGGVSPFGRVNAETNTSISYPAYGRLNGQATLTAYLDGQPLAVTTNASGDASYPYEWRAMMELTPGVHQLKVAALHPSGFFTAWATNTFTNDLADETATIGRDGEGNVGQRIWRKPDGSIERQQQLYWDAKNRLTDVFDGDANHTGFYWHAVYDGLNRRILTEVYPMTNGVAQIAGVTPTTIYQYYDPQVEFLELGVAYSTRTEWKLYGPDLNGQYGGLNGTGGFDGVSPYFSLFDSTISDYRGDILGEVTNGVVSWFPSRPTGYGAVPGYRPVALGHGADISLASAWRGRWPDITGYYQIGMRTYDSVSGMWLSYDPTWNERDPSYLTFCGGDPINGFDPDGRISKDVYNFEYKGGVSGYLLNGIGNTLNSYSGDNSYIGASASFAGTLFNETGGAVSPSTYANGLGSYGHNVASYYNDDGWLPATSYALTSWNVGSIYAGAENFDLHYDTAGQQIGDWSQRGATIAGGVAGTTGVASGGLSLLNWASSALNTSIESSLPSEFNVAGAQNAGNAGTPPPMGTVYVNPPPNATLAQIQQIQAYVNGANQAVDQGILMGGRVSTAGALRLAANRAADIEAARGAAAGTPYLGQVGHVPDTTWIGVPEPFSWLDLEPRVNLSIGGQARRYPLGYVPTDFQVGPPPPGH